MVPHQRITKDMNSLPADVVGQILSRVASAHDVERASATCRLWRHAADHHAHRLAFDFRDFQVIDKKGRTDDEELHQDRMEIITKAVLRRTCLRNLSISDVRICRAAPLVAWLLHTKQTLKSLTLRSLSVVNLSEELVVRLNPAIHSLPSLACLTLEIGSTSPRALQTGKDIELLLSLLPKLAFLALSWDCIFTLPSGSQTDVLILPSSLKTLFLKGFHDFQHNCSYDQLVLQGDNLQILFLSEVGARHITIFGHNLQHLSVESARDVVQIEARNLSSLQKLGIILLHTELLEQTLHSLASTTVSELEIGLLLEFSSIDKIIASSFPCVRHLMFCTMGRHIPLRKSLQEPIKLKTVVSLQLHMYPNMSPHQPAQPDIVPQLIINSFPNLKQLTFALSRLYTDDDAKRLQDILTSVLDNLRQSFPLLDVKVIFLLK